MKSMSRLLWLGGILFSIYVEPAFSEDLPTLGIMDLAAREGVSKANSSIITDFLFDSVYTYGNDQYRIIDRDVRDLLLEEHEFSQTDVCDAISCALEVGKYLAADYILIGSFAKLGNYYHIILKIANVRTTEIEASSKTKTASLDNIEDAIDSGVMELLGEKPEKFALTDPSAHQLKEILKSKVNYPEAQQLSLEEKLRLYQLAKNRTGLWGGVMLCSVGPLLGGFVWLLSDVSDRELNHSLGWGVTLSSGAILLLVSSIRMLYYLDWQDFLDDNIPAEMR
jgi:hypothetical protein